jgi:hypothetical protein
MPARGIFGNRYQAGKWPEIRYHGKMPGQKKAEAPGGMAGGFRKAMVIGWVPGDRAGWEVRQEHGDRGPWEKCL